MNQDVQPIEELQPVVAALQNTLGSDLVALILFGSQARRDAQPDSDWDLLLLAEHLPDSPWRRQQQIAALLPVEWRHRLSVLAHTPAEWFVRVTPLALDIALDGIVLYDGSQGLVSSRLAALRRQLAQIGLERQPIDSEWIWVWQDAPPTHWELEWAR